MRLNHPPLAAAMLAMLALAARAANPAEPPPRSTAILEIAAPAGTRITIDGHDCTGQTEYRCDLGKDTEGELTISAEFRNGERASQKVSIERGWRIPMYLRSGADRRESLIPQIGHAGPIYSVAFSRDGRQVLTGSLDKSAVLWNVETGERLRTFVGHSGYVRSVCFNPNGGEILTGSDDGTAILWDMRTGERLRTVAAHPSGVFAAAYRAGGKEFITRSNDGVATIWDSRTGKRLRSLGQKTDGSSSIYFSSDGAQVVIDVENKPTVMWTESHGERPLKLDARRAVFWPLAFSPDGSLMIGGTRDNDSPPSPGQNGEAIFAQQRLASVWNPATGKLVATLQGHSDNVNCAAFLPDGRKVVTGSNDDTAILWDVQSGKKIRVFAGHKSCVYSVACSPDGKLLLTGSGDNAAILWDIQTGKKLRALAEASSGRSWLEYTGGYRQATLWNLAAGGHVRTCRFSKDAFGVLACSADGLRVATRSKDGAVTVWDAATGKIVHEFQAPDAECGVTEFSPDGSRLLIGAGGRTLDLWDIRTGKKLQSLSPKEAGAEVAAATAFSPDGAHVLACYHNVNYLGLSVMHRTHWVAGAATIWSVQTGERILTLDAGPDGDSFRYVAYSHNGREVLTRSERGRTILWNARTGAIVRTITPAGNYTVGSDPASSTGELVFAPDDRRILMEDFGRNETAVLCDSRSGRRLRTHAGSPVGFNADGSQYMIRAEDGTERLLSAATGQELAQLIRVNAGEDWLVKTPDGVFDCSEGGRRFIRYRDPKDPLKMLRVEQGFEAYYHPNLLADILAGHAVAPPDWKRPADGQNTSLKR